MEKYIPQRGQLKYSINSSSQRFESGKEFSISISVTNPFDVPVQVKSVTTKLPIEFTDVMKKNFEKQKSVLENKITKIIKSNVGTVNFEEEQKKNKKKAVIDECLRLLPFGSAIIAGNAVAEYIKASSASSAASICDIADIITEEDVNRISNSIQSGKNSKEEFEGEMFKLLNEKMSHLKKNLEQSVILQPGNSSVYVFTLRTNKTIFLPLLLIHHIYKYNVKLMKQ